MGLLTATPEALAARHRHERLTTARVAAKAPPALAPSQRVTPTFYGLNAQALFNLPVAQWDAQLAKLAATGVGTVRFDAGWGGVEPKPPAEGLHDYRWERLDDVVGALAAQGLRGLPVLDYAAPWAESTAYPPSPGFAPPASPVPFAEFARALAARYGAGGQFWAEHPELPAEPVDAYEIWNEENTDHFFHGADPVVYAGLYAAARDAIREVSTGATVMVGGLVPTPEALAWLNSFIDALPERGSEIDAIGWHPYFTSAAAVYGSLHWLHTELDAHDLDPPIVLTEVNDPEEAGGPALLSELAAQLPDSNCGVTGMIVHTWTPSPEGEDPAYSIADAAGTPNVAGAAYESTLQGAIAAGVAPQPALCGRTASVAPAGARYRLRLLHGRTLRLRRRR